jgi:Carboxypeptidase regulatory-like domain
MAMIKTSFAAVLLLTISVACMAQDKTTGAIKGKVRVEQGTPGGVAVILLQGEQEVSRAATDKRGEFTIPHVVPGVYIVKFRKPGLTVGSIDGLEVKAGKTRSLHDLVLGIDEGSIAFLRGSVFTESGRSVAGVRVELVKVVDENSVQKMDARVTGETGEFVFRLSPETAKYRVTVKADGAQPASKDIDVDSAAIYRVALTLKPIPKN